MGKGRKTNANQGMGKEKQGNTMERQSEKTQEGQGREKTEAGKGKEG